MILQPAGHPRGAVQAERAAAGQHDGVHALDEIARIEGIGLPGARATAAHIDGGDRAAFGSQHDGCSGQPSASGALRMPDTQPGYVCQRVGPAGSRGVMSGSFGIHERYA